MNKGVYFSTPRKSALTVVNVLILGIACVLVSDCIHWFLDVANATPLVWHGSLGIWEGYSRQSQQRKLFLRKQCIKRHLII